VWEGRMKWFTKKILGKKQTRFSWKKLKIKEITKPDFLGMKVDIRDYINDIDRNIKTIELFLDINRENIRYIEEENNVIKVAYYEKKS
jgi:hypothetical protein